MMKVGRVGSEPSGDRFEHSLAQGLWALDGGRLVAGFIHPMRFRLGAVTSVRTVTGMLVVLVATALTGMLVVLVATAVLMTSF